MSYRPTTPTASTPPRRSGPAGFRAALLTGAVSTLLAVAVVGPAVAADTGTPVRSGAGTRQTIVTGEARVTKVDVLATVGRSG
ncbi:hypothetical protein [Streptomyces sp. cg40]|uniref:hypothetical protein n=1 Tax=Streptomyces sp. cg40 TaxID=3419764 RepID=UPI003D04EC6C